MSSSGSRTHDYKCHGTTTLFAALDTAADEILTDHRLGTAARKGCHTCDSKRTLLCMCARRVPSPWNPADVG
jgi:hypothetical protein